MRIEPQIYDIGTLNYIFTVFSGKSFEVDCIRRPIKDTNDCNEMIVDEVCREEKAMLSISKKFLILTYMRPDGTRHPVWIKACRLENDGSGVKGLFKAFGMAHDTRYYTYRDQDGWEWSLHISQGPRARSVHGRGFILINEGDKTLYTIQLR